MNRLLCCAMLGSAMLIGAGVAPADDQPEAKIDVDLLAGGWTHSREEDKNFKGKVYRRSDSMKFPPSRFRERYVFKKDGTGKVLSLSSTDAHRMVACQWKVAEDNPRRIKITTMKGGKQHTESVEVLELTEKILRVK